MIQSSHFTKTTPRFPFADLCIPAGQSLLIHRSQTPGGGETTDVWKIESMETMLPPRANRTPRKQLHPTPNAFFSFADSEAGFENSESLCSKSSPETKTLKEVATPEFHLVNFAAREKFTPLERKRCPKNHVWLP